MQKIYELILLPWLCIAIMTFIVLLKINAPYGKFFNTKFGFSLPYKIGWFLQESISPIIFSVFFLINGVQSHNNIIWVFFAIWVFHYFYRSVIFPLRMGANGSRIPITIIFSAVSFNIIMVLQMDITLVIQCIKQIIIVNIISLYDCYLSFWVFI